MSMNDPNKEYWDAQPCNSLHSDFRPGTLAYYDEVRRRRYHVEYHIPEFADFHRWAGKSVLDVGSGLGTDTTSFALAGARVRAIDQSDTAIYATQRQLEAYGCSGITTIAKISPTLQLGEQFDLVWSFGVLHHTEDMKTSLDFCVRHMKPGGTLKIMLYHKRSLKALMCALGLWQYEAQANVPIVRTFTTAQGCRMLREHGLDVTGVQTRHVFPWNINEYKNKRYTLAWPALFTPFQSIIGWHLLLTAVKPRSL